jgi:hypothetical protein
MGRSFDHERLEVYQAALFRGVARPVRIIDCTRGTWNRDKGLRLRLGLGLGLGLGLRLGLRLGLGLGLGEGEGVGVGEGRGLGEGPKAQKY